MRRRKWGEGRGRKRRRQRAKRRRGEGRRGGGEGQPLLQPKVLRLHVVEVHFAVQDGERGHAERHRLSGLIQRLLQKLLVKLRLREEVADQWRGVPLEAGPAMHVGRRRQACFCACSSFFSSRSTSCAAMAASMRSFCNWSASGNVDAATRSDASGVTCPVACRASARSCCSFRALPRILVCCGFRTILTCFSSMSLWKNGCAQVDGDIL